MESRCAGFTHGEADGLRRAMARSEQHPGRLAPFGEKLIVGMLARGYSLDFAQRCFRQLQGFSQYGFPESHSASFALLVYVSAWLKHHHPAAFTCALLNSQPMGFYGPAQLVRDAKEHGVPVRPVDVNHSRWDCTLEPARADASPALRLGLRMVRGLNADAADAVATVVMEHGPCHDIASLWRSSGVGTLVLRRLAEADAFQSMGLDRQRALWQILRLRDVPAPLFEAQPRDRASTDDTAEPLPPVLDQRRVARDYASTGLSLKQHPVHFLRERLDSMHATPAAALRDERRWPHSTAITVAGLVTIRQCPSTARGIIFITLEDETGSLNLVVRPRVYARCRAAVRTAYLVLARGHIERRGQVVHVVVHSLHDLSRSLDGLISRSRDLH